MKDPKAVFNDELKKAAFRVAGHLVAAEAMGAGGWSVIWKGPETDELPITAPAICYTWQAPDNAATVKLAGLLAEKLADTSALRRTELWNLAHEAQALTGADCPADELQIEQAVFLIQRHWPQVKDYANAHLEQWECPEDLPLFRLDLVDNGGTPPPAHHLPALESGALTAASLFQSPEKTYALPDKIRARIH